MTFNAQFGTMDCLSNLQHMVSTNEVGPNHLLLHSHALLISLVYLTARKVDIRCICTRCFDIEQITYVRYAWPWNVAKLKLAKR
jgi:hypothetical protein